MKVQTESKNAQADAAAVELCPCMPICPLEKAMAAIGGKWKIPILCALVRGPARYNEIKRRVHGISNTMLTKALTELEEDGIVTRKEYMEVPARVEYNLTPLACELKPIIYALVKWGSGLPD